MESAFDPKPNVKAPSAIKIAVLSMCSPPSNDDDHSCRRKHDRLPPSNSRVELRSSHAWAAAQAPRAATRRHRAAECGQQFPPSDGDCHTPSRARCVNGTIPLRERAVLTAPGAVKPGMDDEPV